MFASWKRHGREFLAARSGTRFQVRYRQRQLERSTWRVIVSMCLAVVLVPIGFVMLVLPGPGILVLILAAALVAGESMWVARGLDRVDLAFSRGWNRWRRRGQQRSGSDSGV